MISVARVVASVRRAGASWRKSARHALGSSALMPRFIIACAISVFVIAATPQRAGADEVDDFITGRMRNRHIMGISIAVIDGGKIVRAQGYGFTDKSGATPVTP